MSRQGSAGHGEVRQDWRGEAGHGEARQAIQGADK